ncbi:iron chelate uptake ABC transporter family permease subunit [Bartonella sp. HY329]|uniref:iron chelate uptake ABC transporter family permease subunit n=1 Tax=unclassified Bartonella TaxID=2645622 RepID=UPI0021C87670|nr:MULTISPECIES: iron chelate uptake ABC transporter family permease subunit [unclassified Bartonella]UXM95866.1 iron chelate uptake ABC transporter family permease subunit [Bartonella sp. HY329]UXN10191.1 iron chelate uptake ABC transporter family permease subunit [Bartonella sp. HY328]
MLKSISRPICVIALLAFIAILFSVLFMSWNLLGSVSYALSLRSKALASLILVGYAIAISTILFQTVTNNRILTPSIMGFDQLYLLVQTIVVYIFGISGITLVSGLLGFIIQTLILIIFATSLFRWLFVNANRSLFLVLLVGIVLGVFFRSLNVFLLRKIDPDSFVGLQERFFANFNSVNPDALLPAFCIILVVSIFVFAKRNCLDTLALGREISVNLGINYKKNVTLILLLITILVSVSTALVGPVLFFGILVASLAYQLAGSYRHVIILPVAALLAIIFLVGGQFIMIHIFNLGVPLAVIINFIGGITVIGLLLKGSLR